MIRVKIGLDSEKTRFQVPTEIVDIDNNIGTCDGADCKLSSYITVDTTATPASLITVKSKAKGGDAVDVWSLNALI